MYSTCIFCHTSLGHNEAVENFPVGRRLAFDSDKGRLWAVCKKCGRWNLTPIEERWEAIEECERLYRSTIIRASTDQVGLAKIREGTDLIRIGKPLRPEFAAWRYTRYFNRQRLLVYGGGAATVLVGGLALFVGGPAIGLISPTAMITTQFLRRASSIGRARKVILNHARRGLGKKIGEFQQIDLRIIPANDAQGWGLRFAHEGKFLDHFGWEATHLAHLVAPALNFEGGSPRSVAVAVSEIERAGSPGEYFREVLRYGQAKGWNYTGLFMYPHSMRLAFEMASHEETERAAIDGDLTRLESDWREAEEIASIADSLLLPQQVTDLLERFKQTRRTDSR